MAIDFPILFLQIFELVHDDYFKFLIRKVVEDVICDKKITVPKVFKVSNTCATLKSLLTKSSILHREFEPNLVTKYGPVQVNRSFFHFLAFLWRTKSPAEQFMGLILVLTLWIENACLLPRLVDSVTLWCILSRLLFSSEIFTFALNFDSSMLCPTLCHLLLFQLSRPMCLLVLLWKT